MSRRPNKQSDQFFNPPRGVSEQRAQNAVKRADQSAGQALRATYTDLLTRAPEHDFSPTLDRVTKALAFLGSPEQSFASIHVAGTNGKTSTARMIESLLRAMGLRTGLFTSPHLSNPRERIVLDGHMIPPGTWLNIWQEVTTVVDLIDQESVAAGGPRMSFFEVLTVMALAAFADAPVDVAVVEVGMGGRWDATNLVKSAVQVITPISLDHQQWLGTTVQEIAQEKAGIFIENGCAVIGQQNPAVSQVLSTAAQRLDTKLVWLGEDFSATNRVVAVGGQVLDFCGLETNYKEIFLPLHGSHQADNAACALAAVELLLRQDAEATSSQIYLGGIDQAVVEQGFEQVKSPGRLEVLRSMPTVIIDAAHNPAGAQALVAGLDEAFGIPLVGLVAVLADKDAEGLLGVLEPIVDRLVITQTTSPRAMPAQELGELAVQVFSDPDRVETIELLPDALARAIELAEADSGESPSPLATGVIATGSVSLAGEVRLLLKGGTFNQ